MEVFILQNIVFCFQHNDFLRPVHPKNRCENESKDMAYELQKQK